MENLLFENTVPPQGKGRHGPRVVRWLERVVELLLRVLRKSFSRKTNFGISDGAQCGIERGNGFKKVDIRVGAIVFYRVRALSKGRIAMKAMHKRITGKGRVLRRLRERQSKGGNGTAMRQQRSFLATNQLCIKAGERARHENSIFTKRILLSSAAGSWCTLPRLFRSNFEMEMKLTVHARHSNDDQHAIFAVVRNLSILKLHTWCPVLMLWLAQYDGIEQYLDPDESPPIAVRNLLARYIATGEHVFPKTLVAGLSALPFLHYRAVRSDDRATEWDPLWMSFMEFSKGRDVSVWYSDNPCPASSEIRASLLSAYMRQQAGDRSWYAPIPATT